MLACVNLCAAAFAHSTEGCGFSNDAKALLGVPPFSAAGIPYDGRNLDLTISLHY